MMNEREDTVCERVFAPWVDMEEEMRKDDIPLLVNHFIRLICEETGMPVRKVDDDAMELLQKHAWTGNIRELRNVTERLLILGGNTITKEDVMAYATPQVG